MKNAARTSVAGSRTNLVVTTKRKENEQRKLGPEDVESSRSEVLKRWDAELFQRMEPEDLIQIQSALHHGSMFGIWETPPEWLTKRQATPAVTRIDLRARLKAHIEKRFAKEELVNPRLSDWLEFAVLTLTRVLLLMRCTGLPGRSRGRSPSPSTLLNYAYIHFIHILSAAVVNGLRSQDHFGLDAKSERVIFGLITAQQAIDISDAGTWVGHVLNIADRLTRWSESGLWSDVFAAQGASSIDDLKAGRLRNNRAQHVSEEFKPLPDEYTSSLIKRSLWLMREISPNLIRAIPGIIIQIELNRKRVSTGLLNKSNLAAVKSRSSTDLIKRIEWLDVAGVPLERFTFPIALTSTNEAKGWFPQNRRDFFDLMAFVQTAHQIIIGLTMGCRASELLEMRRDCVVERTKDGEKCYFIRSKTFKTVGAHEGEMREWPVVAQAVEAVESQIRLMQCLDKINQANDDKFIPNDNLWGRFYIKSNQADAFTGTNNWLSHYVQAFGLDTKPGGQNFTSHRLRKTLARIVALAIVDSPMVLYEIFGHRSIEMTLHYILANKDLRSEIEAITREISVMRAKEVIEVMAQAELRREQGQSLPGDLYGGCSGGAAGPISAYVAEEVRKVHDRGEEWGAENAIELAQLFTNAGRQWMLVRKGVLCTKSPGTSGPCSVKSRGRPEPSKCEASCSHRLEREFLRDDVREILDTAIKGYEKALADDEAGVAAYWGGQIGINIKRFADLEQEYMRLPSVQAYMKTRVAEAVK